jgi:hypothetical protein
MKTPIPVDGLRFNDHPEGPRGRLETAGKEAWDSYSKPGAFTTAASVIASWAVIDARIN